MPPLDLGLGLGGSASGSGDGGGQRQMLESHGENSSKNGGMKRRIVCTVHVIGMSLSHTTAIPQIGNFPGREAVCGGIVSVL
jgi:hypothetical protein